MDIYSLSALHRAGLFFTVRSKPSSTDVFYFRTHCGNHIPRAVTLPEGISVSDVNEKYGLSGVRYNFYTIKVLRPKASDTFGTLMCNHKLELGTYLINQTIHERIAVPRYKPVKLYDSSIEPSDPPEIPLPTLDYSEIESFQLECNKRELK